MFAARTVVRRADSANTPVSDLDLGVFLPVVIMENITPALPAMKSPLNEATEIREAKSSGVFWGAILGGAFGGTSLYP